MVKARGPVFALLTLIALAANGVFLEIRSHQTDPGKYGRPAESPQQHGPRTDSAAKPTKEQNDAKGGKDSKWDKYLPDKLSDVLLVIFNGLLALFTFRLYRHTSGLEDATRGMLKAAVDQGDLMKRSVATATTSAAASMRSAIATEKLLESGERPYIFVFGVRRLAVKAARTRSHEAFIEYSIANYGKTPAIIEDVRIRLSESRAFPEPTIRSDETHNLFVSPILASGERRDDLREILPPEIDRTMHWDGEGKAYVIPAMQAVNDLFFRVIIHYRGAFTEAHESSFCWRYDKSTAHFVQHGGNEYNYVG
jgi:hypothetical protein